MKQFLLASVVALWAVVTLAKDCEKEASSMAEVRFCILSESDNEVNNIYNNLVKATPDKKIFETLNKAQLSWIKFRDDTCSYVAQSDAEGQIEADAEVNCRVEFNDGRIKVLKKYAKSKQEVKHPENNTEAIQQLEQQSEASTSSEPLDINAVSGNMFVDYYNHGVTAMTNRENACWKRLYSEKNISTARECFLMTFTGSIIEAGFAQKQGRTPVPFYSAQVMMNRGLSNMGRAGISDKVAKSEVIGYVGERLPDVLTALANAGM